MWLRMLRSLANAAETATFTPTAIACAAAPAMVRAVGRPLLASAPSTHPPAFPQAALRRRMRT